MSLIFALLQTIIINYFFIFLVTLLQGTTRSMLHGGSSSVSLMYLLKVTLSVLPLLHHLKINLYKCLFYFLQHLQSILHNFWFP